MGAYAHAQNIFGNDANRLTLLSNKQSDDVVVSSFAHAVRTRGNRRGRMPWKGAK